jgi:hypothetical protein
MALLDSFLGDDAGHSGICSRSQSPLEIVEPLADLIGSLLLTGQDLEEGEHDAAGLRREGGNRFTAVVDDRQQ